jgi:hypothetical protein
VTKISRIASLTILALVTSSGALAADGHSCDCEAALTELDACRQIDWSRHAGASPRTPDDLNALLDELTEGSPQTAVQVTTCIAKSSCFVDRDVEAIVGPCQRAGFHHYLKLVTTAKEPEKRWASLGLALGTYMDVTPTTSLLSTIEGLAFRLLNDERDPVLKAALLSMLSSYDVETPRVIEATLSRMSDTDAVVRYFASALFQHYTNVPLRFNAAGASSEREKQLGAIKKWWQTKKSSHASGDT